MAIQQMIMPARSKEQAAMAPEQAAHISNLQMLPALDNRKKFTGVTT